MGRVTKPTLQQRQMSEALYENDIPTIYRLLKDGFNPNSRWPGPYRWTAGHMAASYGRVTALTMFFECGLDYRVLTGDGRSLYEVASIGGMRATEEVIMVRKISLMKADLAPSEDYLSRAEKKRILEHKEKNRKIIWPQLVHELIHNRLDRGATEEGMMIIDLLSKRTRDAIPKLWLFKTEEQREAERRLLRRSSEYLRGRLRS